MPRVKRGTMHTKKRKSLLKKVKGYRFGRNKLYRAAKVAVNKAGEYSRIDRRKKKRNNKALWHIKINAVVREYELTYSRLMDLLKKKNILLDKKILADLAENNREILAKLIEEIKK